ncbi:MAG: LytTR family DNA-binding domain-containing protein [Erysipelotrichales bacterium]|nr:LytTR family DNA-binding domain-containing protein [Erysipelotrichales bacterium]
MAKMNILCCDEKQEFIEKWIQRVKPYLGDEKCYCIDACTTVAQVDQLLLNKEYDIAFIDTEINGESGIELVGRLRIRNPRVCIFLVTEHEDYITTAFNIRVFQYIFKNDKREAILEREIRRAIRLYKFDKVKCFIHSNNGRHGFMPQEIYYIETRNGDVKMSTTLGDYYGEIENIEKMKKELQWFDFYQVHQNYFVNMNTIISIKKGGVLLENNEIIPTSILNREMIKERIDLFLKSE